MSERAQAVRIQGLTVRYSGRRVPALDDVSLTVGRGERLGIAGRTGAGKSTLALAVAGLIPRVVRASVAGRILIDGTNATDGTDPTNGTDAIESAPGDLLGRLGIVFPSPSNQLSGSKLTVREELAFGLENLGVPRSEMDGRIDAVMGRLGIEHLAEREPSSLSGGEQQRVAIASIVTMGPEILVLDEPAAELDPAGAAAVAVLLDDLAAAGTTILHAEHDPAALGACGRVIILEAGRIVSAIASAPACEPLAWTVGPGRAGASVIIEHVRYRYPNGIEALRDVSLRIGAGEAVAIVGANGSGKTTLAKQLNGLLRPTHGRVLLDDASTDDIPADRLAATVGFAFQDPGDQLFERSVEREVSFGPRQLGRSGPQASELVEAALAMTGLTGERAVNPYDLDRSRRKLVALAGVLAMDPAVLVLDEPTTGQDGDGVERVGLIVRAMQTAGRTVIAITHDIAFATQWFDRVVVMDEGRLADHPPPAA